MAIGLAAARVCCRNVRTSSQMRLWPPLPGVTMVAAAVVLSLGTERAPAQRALGMDSDFHCCSVNFVTAANNGIQFACIKATALDEGFSNSVFAARMSAAQSAGIYTIPYNRCNPSAY